MEKIEEEIDSVELPAPAGWKKFGPKNSDIPKRNVVLFISPTGEEIRNRKHLSLFLRTHPGGPSPAKFDWRYGGAPRRSARINDEKKKVADTPEEGPKSHKRKSNSNDRRTKHQKNGRDNKKEEKDTPEERPKSHKRKSNSNHRRTKHQKNGGDTEKKEKDEVPENEKTAAQVEGGIADAEMKDVVEDSSIKEQVECTAKTIEDETEVKVAGQDSAEIQEGKNINEPEKLQPEDSNKDAPAIVFAPEETSAVSENQELGVEEIGEGVPVLNEHEESKKEHSYGNEHHEESKDENSFVSEHEEKRGAEVGSNEVPALFMPALFVPALFVPEVTKGENLVVRESPVASKGSPRDAESSKEVLREKEVKDRVFLNDSHKWEQKTVSST